MNKVGRYVQELLIFKLIYPILLRYIDENLITMTEEMEKDKMENNIPKLEICTFNTLSFGNNSFGTSKWLVKPLLLPPV